MPPGLTGFDGAVGSEHVGLPGSEIRLFGKLPGCPQMVEDLAVEGAGIEERLIEAPELAIGGVVEDQSLARIEHRHGGGKLVEGADIGVHLALQVGADALQFGDIHGDSDAA